MIQVLVFSILSQYFKDPISNSIELCMLWQIMDDSDDNLDDGDDNLDNIEWQQGTMMTDNR